MRPAITLWIRNYPQSLRWLWRIVSPFFMSQVTITDVKDVRAMPSEEIDQWILDHERDPMDHRYAGCIIDDLAALRAEKARRANAGDVPRAGNGHAPKE